MSVRCWRVDRVQKARRKKTSKEAECARAEYAASKMRSESSSVEASKNVRRIDNNGASKAHALCLGVPPQGP